MANTTNVHFHQAGSGVQPEPQRPPIKPPGPKQPPRNPPDRDKPPPIEAADTR